MNIASLTVTEWIQLVSTGAIMPVLVFMLYKDMNKRYEQSMEDSKAREEVLRKEAKEREDHLMKYLEDKNRIDSEQSKSFEKIVITLDRMESRMSNLENKLK